ncbi:MAG TPA: hypothetical protein VLM42_01750 [Bryobacteraceae bacterium]|nr:hypothetical protein [Bryobacteraceae bacterium]
MPGGFMAGQVQWPIFGVILLAAGVSLLVSARRRQLLRKARERSRRRFPAFLV